MPSYETSAAVASAVVSGLALWFSINEARISRKHARLTVRPILSDDTKIDPSEQRCGLFLKNNGMGPAHIKSWTLLVDGKPYRELGIDKWEKLTEHLEVNRVVTYGYYKAGHVLSVGACDDLFTIEMVPYTAEEARKLRSALRRLTIRIKYQSVYQDDTFLYEFVGSQHFKPEA